MGGIRIQVDPDKVTNQRSIYNLLNLLGDVGGLLEALRQTGGLLLLILGKGDLLSGFLLRKVFKKVSRQESEQDCQRDFKAKNL